MRNAVSITALAVLLLVPLATLAGVLPVPVVVLGWGLLAVPVVFALILLGNIYLDHRPERFDPEFPFLLPEESSLIEEKGYEAASDLLSDDPITVRERPVPRVEVYQDRADEWRWHLVAANRKIIADSGEGYVSKSNARRAANRVRETVVQAHIVERLDEQVTVDD